MALNAAEQARMDGLVANLRFKIGDFVPTLPAVPAFSKEQLETILTEAMLRHNASYTLMSLPDTETALVVYIAWIDICAMLAMDSAKEFKLSLDGMSIEKDTRVKSYMDLAKFLAEKYEAAIKELTPLSDSGDIVMGELTRTALEIDRTVPYFSDRGLQRPYLQPVALAGTTATLIWSPIFHSSFQRYDVYRNDVKIAAKFDSHFVSYADEGLVTGTYKYKVTVRNMSEVGTDSNIQEVVVP